MRILSWVKGKLNVKPEEKRKKKKKSVDLDHTADTSALCHNVAKNPEEFKDWPNGLLAIGTFGDTRFAGDSQRCASSEISDYSGFTGDSQRYASSESSSTSQNLSNFTTEEVSKLQKELKRQLALKSKSGSFELGLELGRKDDLPLGKFLNYPSKLEIDRRDHRMIPENLENGEGNGDVSPATRMVLLKANNILSSEKRNSINKRSFKFLLKKICVCGGGFRSVPGLTDPIPETRMEKLLRTIVQKIYYQYPSPTTRMKYLDKNSMDEKDIEDDPRESKDCGSRWVKTDSEYIVLEI